MADAEYFATAAADEWPKEAIEGKDGWPHAIRLDIEDHGITYVHLKAYNGAPPLPSGKVDKAAALPCVLAILRAWTGAVVPKKPCRILFTTHGRMDGHHSGKEHVPLPDVFQEAMGVECVAAPFPFAPHPLLRRLLLFRSTWSAMFKLKKTPEMWAQVKANVEKDKVAAAGNAAAAKAAHGGNRSASLDDDEYFIFLTCMNMMNSIRLFLLSTKDGGAAGLAQRKAFFSNLGYQALEPVDAPADDAEAVAKERKRRKDFEETAWYLFNGGNSHTSGHGEAALLAAWVYVPQKLRSAAYFIGADDDAALKEKISNLVGNLKLSYDKACASRLATGGGAQGAAPADDGDDDGVYAAAQAAADAEVQQPEGGACAAFAQHLQLAPFHLFNTPPPPQDFTERRYVWAETEEGRGKKLVSQKDVSEGRFTFAVQLNDLVHRLFAAKAAVESRPGLDEDAAAAAAGGGSAAAKKRGGAKSSSSAAAAAAAAEGGGDAESGLPESSMSGIKKRRASDSAGEALAGMQRMLEQQAAAAKKRDEELAAWREKEAARGAEAQKSLASVAESMAMMARYFTKDG